MKASVNESIEWLRTNREPWDLIESHWNATSETRKNQFAAIKGGSVELCLEKWEILRHPMGWKLRKKDFGNWGFSNIENAANKLPEFFGRLLAIAPLSEKSKIYRVQELTAIVSKHIDHDSKAIAQLCFMAYMIPPKGRIRVAGSSHWKSSMVECEDSLVAHVQNSAEIVSIRERRIQAMRLKKSYSTTLHHCRRTNIGQHRGVLCFI